MFCSLEFIGGHKLQKMALKQKSIASLSAFEICYHLLILERLLSLVCILRMGLKILIILKHTLEELITAKDINLLMS